MIAPLGGAAMPVYPEPIDVFPFTVSLEAGTGVSIPTLPVWAAKKLEKASKIAIK
jgi:hypothetical protein